MSEFDINKSVFRDDLVPENSETASVGTIARRFKNGRFRTLISDVGTFLSATMANAFGLPSYTTANLPAAGNAGNIARITDGLAAGALVIDDGTNWNLDAIKSQKIVVVTGPPYNAKGDGTTDDTTAIQNAINAVTTGGVVWFPQGVYKITSTLTVTTSSVALAGAGAYSITDASGAPATIPGAVLQWGGAANGTMLQLAPTTGATLPALKKMTVRDLSFDGQASAGIGLQLLSVQYSYFSNLWFKQFTVASIDTNVTSPLGEITTTSRCLFENIQARNLSTAGIALRLGGSAAGDNTTYNTFVSLYLIHNTGTSLQLGNADNNTFVNTNITQSTGGTGIGIELLAAPTAPGAARNNYFYHCSPGLGGVTARGTPSNTSPSVYNWFYGYPTDNSEPVPVVEAGAIITYITDRYAHVLPMLGAGLGESLANAESAVANISSASARIKNTTGNHVVLDDGTNVFGMNINAGVLRLTAQTGGTGVQIAGGANGVEIGGPTGGAPAAGALNISGTYQINGVNIAPTLTVKSGSGAADYTTTSATYVDVDATNLAYTVTIPTGWKLYVTAACEVKNSTLAAAMGLALFDTVGAGAVIAEELVDAAVAGDREHMGLTHVVAGDGAAHTIKLQWKASAATSTMGNSSATLSPRMTFILSPSQ